MRPSATHACCRPATRAPAAQAELQAALDAQQKAAAAGERRWEERYAADVEAVRVEMEQARRSVQAEKKEAQVSAPTCVLASRIARMLALSPLQ